MTIFPFEMRHTNSQLVNFRSSLYRHHLYEYIFKFFSSVLCQPRKLANVTEEWKQVKVTNFGHESDLISMCQRCSSSLCRFSTAFCFCFFSLLSCSFLARLLGLISTGSSGFTFFYRRGDKTNVSHCIFYTTLVQIKL